ncbi:ABC transporter substrate-binding protein [Streptomyces sp. BPTC-684]|uniref:ABC transporter substrate-binding protein n=1 Tax=Streptomyces sp. BPTC-684 TaxID=3043734 RepID=UPI0024B198E3|nr:ABC transporter substrate-binding protein [Streptomyces sp. BPTC-684]WHM38168.1 ABC transporter substrate-binding protein [Streptomyces sp. BPTC-684]
MTGWRSSSSPRPFHSVATALVAVCTAVGASLVTGCGVIPGTTGGSREPVTVMTWAPDSTRATNMPGMPSMAQAYARWVNANGGIDGHKLQVLTCNEHNTATGAAECARRAVKEHAVAVVGSYSQHGRAFMAPLEAAGIPYIGGYGVSDEEFSSALSYPVNGGQATLLAGTGKQLAVWCEKVALVRPDTVSGDIMPLLLNSGLTTGHRKPSADIRTTEDAGDYTPQAQEALVRAGADPELPGKIGKKAAAERARKGCVTAVLGARTETFFDSFRRVEDDGQKVQIASVLGSVGQPLIDRTGGADGPFEGAYITGWYPEASDARWGPMRQVIREQAFRDDTIDAADAGVQTTWIAYTVLKKVVESLDKNGVAAHDLIRALNKGVSVETGGLTPTLRWKFEDMLAAPDFPRIVNRDVTFQVVKAGRLTAARRGFTDVSTTLEDASALG